MESFRKQLTFVLLLPLGRLIAVTGSVLLKDQKKHRTFVSEAMSISPRIGAIEPAKVSIELGELGGSLTKAHITNSDKDDVEALKT